MNSVLLAIIGIAIMSAGYLVYSRVLASRVYRLDPDFVTPAHAQRDGIDYVPTNRLVLWGHHFTSVAGAAPIVGPAIAVIWGPPDRLRRLSAGPAVLEGVAEFQPVDVVEVTGVAGRQGETPRHAGTRDLGVREGHRASDGLGMHDDPRGRPCSLQVVHDE